MPPAIMEMHQTAQSGRSRRIEREAAFPVAQDREMLATDANLHPDHSTPTFTGRMVKRVAHRRWKKTRTPEPPPDGTIPLGESGFTFQPNAPLDNTKSFRFKHMAARCRGEKPGKHAQLVEAP